jgi:flagellin-specific chaperone FliS
MTAYRQAAAAYRAVQALDERPAAVLAAAHERLAGALSAALFAYREGALDRMCRHNAEAIRILNGLTAALEGRSPEADRLVSMYARLATAIHRMLFDSREIETVKSGNIWARDMSRSFRSDVQ